MRRLSSRPRARAPKPKPVPAETTAITLDDRPVLLTVRRHPRAKRMRLRVDFDTAGVILTLPHRATEAHGLSFVRSQTVWIRDRLARIPPRVPLVPGACIPVLGEAHCIRHVPEHAGGIRRMEGAIVVPGRLEDVPGRVTLWLRGEAKRVLSERAVAKAARLGRPVGRISVRDTRTRWGSCSAAGNLSFCWRLIMAPPHVIDYVAAHEVAHLAERNHGPAFWRCVATLTDDIEAARAWLLCHGRNLARYG